MNIQEKLDKIIAKYKSRLDLELEELKDDLMELVGLEGAIQEEISLGEARKAAILTDCLQIQQESELRKGGLSGIALKYGRQPATVGIFFRNDVNLMETRDRANLRYVTEKGKQKVEEYKKKFGSNWISEVEGLLKDKNLPDSYKIKLKTKPGND